MHTIEDATTTEGGTQHRRRAIAAFGVFVAFLFSLTVVLVTAMTDQALVRSRADLARIELGWPLDWVRQDQSSLEPPLPAKLGFSSLWENPTDVSWAAFLADVLIVFAATGVVVALAAALILVRARRARG